MILFFNKKVALDFVVICICICMNLLLDSVCKSEVKQVLIFFYIYFFGFEVKKLIFCLQQFYIFCFAAEALLLAFQHYIVMLGTTVLIASNLVPQMGGSHVSIN